LKIAVEVQSVDKFFLRYFMLILLPLLFYFCIEGIFPASTTYFLFQGCQVIEHLFQPAGLHLALSEVNCFWKSVWLAPVVPNG
jgi:hypothetical protein